DEDDDAAYDDYVATTKDPGDALFLVALSISICSILFLPCFVKLGRVVSDRKRRSANARDARDGDGDGARRGDDDGASDDGALVDYDGGDDVGAPALPADEPERNPSALQRWRRTSYRLVVYALGGVVRWHKRGARGHGHGTAPGGDDGGGGGAERRTEMVSRGVAREAQRSMIRHQRDALVQVDIGDSVEVDDRDLRRSDSVELVVMDRDGAIKGAELEMPPIYEDGDGEEVEAPPIVREGACDVDDRRLDVRDPERSSTQRRAPSSPYFAASAFVRERCRLLKSILRYDNETMRIIRLATPFTISAVIDTLSELIILSLIAQYLGTDSAVSYSMVSIVVGIGSSFMGGWVEAVSSLGSMAYGARNCELVGQYVQTACIVFFLCEIPFAIVLRLTIDKIMLLMGFSEAVAQISKDTVLVMVAMEMLEGINECIIDFLGVIEYEAYANTMFCISAMVDVGLVAIFAVMMEANLVALCLVMLTGEGLLFFLNILIPSRMGWLMPFELGLFGQLALRKKGVLKELTAVAIPLAFGSLLAEAEWEILTIFAAVLGPAEAAAWAMLGFIWDVFESTTEAIGDASEVRCSYQLGKGRPALAKLSAYKSVFLSFVLAILVTTIFLSISSRLPAWLTQDATIQSILAELFPLMALGNITMNCGMVCWALIGAQGRYRLATSVAIGCSFLITVPLGAMLTIWLRIDLQGLTFAVVVGYTFTAMLLSMFLLMSDWEGLSKEIQERMAVEESDDDEDDSSSSSSSSSSISSDESDAVGHDMMQIPTSQSLGVGYFEIPPATPGTFVPPPPPVATSNNPPNPRHDDAEQGNHARAFPYLPANVDSPTGTPNRDNHDQPSGPQSPPRNPTRRPRALSSDQRQAKSLAKLRSLSTHHVGGTHPAQSSSPGSISPNSPGLHYPGSPVSLSTPGSPQMSNSDNVDDHISSAGTPTRVVKGRRRRIA
ncbi:hypothetical protein ACHAWF_004665, partial [Thalassiosira exigua]